MWRKWGDFSEFGPFHVAVEHDIGDFWLLYNYSDIRNFNIFNVSVCGNHQKEWSDVSHHHSGDRNIRICQLQKIIRGISYTKIPDRLSHLDKILKCFGGGTRSSVLLWPIFGLHPSLGKNNNVLDGHGWLRMSRNGFEPKCHVFWNRYCDGHFFCKIIYTLFILEIW